jgi:hypothetical protein
LTRCDFCEFVGSLIVSLRDVIELDAVKLVFKTSYLLTVGFHLKIMVA